MDKIFKQLPKVKRINNRLSQLYFTIRQVVRLAREVNQKALIALIFVSVLSGILTIPTLYLDKLFLDSVIRNIGNPNWTGALTLITAIVFARILITLFGSLLYRVSSYLQRMMGELFDAHLDAKMATKLAELDLATIEDPEFKDRFTKIQRESGRRAWGMMMPLANFIDSSTGFLSAILILTLFSPVIAVGAIIISVPRFFVDSKFIKREYALAAELAPLHKKWGWLNYYLIRNRNFMEVKLLALQEYLTKRLIKVQKVSIDKQTSVRKERMMSNFGAAIPLSALEFGVTIWLVILVLIKELSLGTAQMYIRALGSAQSNLNQMMTAVLSLFENYLYVTDLVWFLGLVPKVETKNEGVTPPATDITITFEDVWFRYRPEQQWVLKGVSFTLSSREHIALVGLNGSGKSTLIKLLARFYDPEKGKVIVNGQDIKTYSIKEWRERLAILFQEFETYVFSVNESIGYGDLDRLGERAHIVKAAKATGMHDYIMNLPLKYKNPLHNDFEFGERPSSGQSQRLGISRMLFRDKAQVLIMDEPTSNVDPEAEEKIFGELLRVSKQKLLIFVTQRFSTVRLADRILVLEKGEIIESGTHADLMKKRGRYKELFELQAKGYK